MDAPPEDLDWTPLRSGGALFRTHHAVQDEQRFELVPSSGARGLIVGVALLGAAMLVGGFVGYRVRADMGLLVVGAAMFVVCEVLAILLRRLLEHSHLFDRASGRYRWTRRPAGELSLVDVRGLQVLRKRVNGPESDYDCDELNLVLLDGRRVNVLDHGEPESLRRDAEALARWLSVPLWIRAQ
jgi:hypothetical protein